MSLDKIYPITCNISSYKSSSPSENVCKNLSVLGIFKRLGLYIIPRDELAKSFGELFRKRPVFISNVPLQKTKRFSFNGNSSLLSLAQYFSSPATFLNIARGLALPISYRYFLKISR